MAMLLESWQTKNYFAYTVELKLREGEIYGSVSFEIPTPKVKYTKENSVENAKKLLTNLIQSLQGEPSGCEGANGRNPAWQVLKVALLFPILGKVLPRDLSPLKPLLVEGAWNRVRSRLVPLSAGGTIPIRDFQNSLVGPFHRLEYYTHKGMGQVVEENDGIIY